MIEKLVSHTVHIKLEAFEGPFDLLFHLIEKNKININDIPIADLADQYMEIIKEYPGDMEFISGFIVMAAALLEIKSRMLLPKPQIETPEEDPRELLVERLLEYQHYKQIAEMLQAYEAEGIKRLFREPESNVLQFLKAKRAVSASEALAGIRLEQFYETYIEVLLRRELRTDKIRAGFNPIPKEGHTIEEKIEYLRTILLHTPQLGFYSLLRVCRSKLERITTFLAMLELVKSNTVIFSQEDNFDDILLQRVEKMS